MRTSICHTITHRTYSRSNTIQINNQFYNQHADTWWDENSPLHLLQTMVNPWRLPYFTEVLKAIYGHGLSGIRILDIGSGGGMLTEPFATLGCRPTGIDISSRSVITARDHARKEGLKIDYTTGSGVSLPFPDTFFDVVFCCDALEHIVNWQEVIHESSRVLKPSGLFLYDTINRTAMSYLMAVAVIQSFPLTRLFPPGTHVWKMFIKPAELTSTMLDHQLIPQDITGGWPSIYPLWALYQIIRHKRGAITSAQLGSRLKLRPTSSLIVNYIGWAQKTVHY